MVGKHQRTCLSNALELLTHTENEEYLEYVMRIKTNPIARKVKIADIKHNTDINRNNYKMPKKYDTYLKELEILNNDI